MNGGDKPIQRRLQSWGKRLPALKQWLTISAPRDIVPEAVPFQADLEEFIEELPPPFMRGTLYFLGLMIVLLLLIAAFVKVDTVVSGTGRLTTVTPPIMLQPLERAIIREIRVKPGESVTKGQVLAIIDPTFNQADYESQSEQKNALTAQLKRLEAELGNRSFVVSKNPSSEEILQFDLFQQHQAQYRSKLQSYEENIRQHEAGIRTSEDDRRLLLKQLEVAQDAETLRSNLLASKTGTKLQYLDSQTMRMRAERDLQDAINRLTELSHGLLSLRAERQNYIDDWHRQLLEETVKARTELAKVSESLTKTERMKDMLVLTAPVDGVVLEVARRTQGSVMHEAEPLVSLIPANAPLVAEISITSGDVGYLKPNVDAWIKVDAFPYQRHGRLHGHLASVSEESFSNSGPSGMNGDPTKAPLFSEQSPMGAGSVHRARIELDDESHLTHLPEGVHLIPGMTLTAELKVGKRSILSYFLYPITRGLSEAVNEP